MKKLILFIFFLSVFLYFSFSMAQNQVSSQPVNSTIGNQTISQEDQEEYNREQDEMLSKGLRKIKDWDNKEDLLDKHQNENSTLR